MAEMASVFDFRPFLILPPCLGGLARASALVNLLIEAGLLPICCVESEPLESLGRKWSSSKTMSRELVTFCRDRLGCCLTAVVDDEWVVVVVPFAVVVVVVVVVGSGSDGGFVVPPPPIPAWFDELLL